MKSNIFVAGFILLLSILFLSLNASGHLTGQNNFNVIVNDSGFFPNSISISQDTKVVWVIKGSQLHWPASDLHPTHMRYPGSEITKCGTIERINIFDACKPIANGQTYEFAFTHIGNWSAHDHMNPSFTMNIEVTDNSGGEIKIQNNQILQNKLQNKSLFKKLFSILKGIKGMYSFKSANLSESGKNLESGKNAKSLQKDSVEEAARIRISCKTNNKENCYEERFKELVGKNGFIFAQETLYKLWDLDPSTRRCHLLAHAIAGEATRLNPEKWKEYIDNVDYTVCSAGFLHGVMEAHIGDDLSFKLDSSKINELCLADGEFYKKQNCVHYMGHLLMLEHSGKINVSLDGCEGISEGLYRRCYTGVFMEDSFPIGLVEHNFRDKLPNRKDISFVNKQRDRCLEFSRDRAVACWTDMGENFDVFYNNPKKVYEACLQAPVDIEKRECFLKAAGLLAIHPAYSTDEKLLGICMPSAQDKDLYKTCIERMISSLLYYSPKFLERGNTICSNVGSGFRDSCYEHLAKILKSTIKLTSERKQYCQQLPPEHKDICLN